MPVVFDNIELPGQGYDALARVEVVLVASLTDPTTPGVIQASDISILDKVVGYTNGAGHIEFNLRTNASIVPANSYYVWTTYFSDGRINQRFIRVTTGGHVSDQEISPAPAVSPFLASLYGQGLESAKPTAAAMVTAGGRTGWRWYSTDLKIWWYFDGTTWQLDGGAVGVNLSRTNGLAAQSIPNATLTTIDNFDGEVSDIHGYHTGSSNAAVVPAGYGGMHSIAASAEFTANATARRGIFILVGGSIVWGQQVQAASVATNTIVSVNAEGILLADGASVTVQVIQNSGGALTLGGGSPYARLALTRG